MNSWKRVKSGHSSGMNLNADITLLLQTFERSPASERAIHFWFKKCTSGSNERQKLVIKAQEEMLLKLLASKNAR